jgi:hypothetical protein
MKGEIGGVFMFIDDQVVIRFLDEGFRNGIKDHWVFHAIEEGKYLFETPNYEKQKDVKAILWLFKKILSDFTPLNKGIFSSLYPEWETIIKNMNILLIVGCPNPYDAMVREKDGRKFIIFDLIRFCHYQELGYDIEGLIRQLITHEISHLCLQEKYPSPKSNNFTDQLKFITFDEGFAHLLAFKDKIETFDFSTISKDHYENAFLKLAEALDEKDPLKQKELLNHSNSGPYWDKFAAISGKIFLGNHVKEIKKLYDNGIDYLISSMGLLKI